MKKKYESLVNSKSPREFLDLALKIKYQKYGKVNFADFSRKCHFSSRSFVKHYIKGEKGISEKSLEKIKKGLRLPRNYALLFEYLVFLDNSKLRPPNLSAVEVKKIIVSLREKINLEALVEKDNHQKLMIRKISTFLVYAALGNDKDGETLESISTKTKLKLSEVSEILNNFKDNQVIRESKGRFFVVSNKLDFLGLGELEGLGTLVEEVCFSINKNRKKIIKNDDNLVLFSTVSINKWDQKKIKKELENAIFDILDKYQDDQGKEILQMFTASYTGN